MSAVSSSSAKDTAAFDLLRNKINLTSQYVSGGTVNYLDWRTIVELPEREKNINPDLVVRAAQ